MITRGTLNNSPSHKREGNYLKPDENQKEQCDDGPAIAISERIEMIITVRSFARFREMFGDEQTIETTGRATPVTVLQALCNEEEKKEALFDSAGVLHPHITIMLNKSRLSPEETKETALKEGDELVVYPPVSGG